jgi:hypothetical protein
MCDSVKFNFKTLNLEIRLFNSTLAIILTVQLTRAPRIWGPQAAAWVALCPESALVCDRHALAPSVHMSLSS